MNVYYNFIHKDADSKIPQVGEVGELCEIFQWTPDSSLTERLKDWPEERKVHLEEELSDVLCYLIRLADRCGVDLPAACLRKIAKNAKKYPVHLAKGSSKKYSELNDSAESQNESNN